MKKSSSKIFLSDPELFLNYYGNNLSLITYEVKVSNRGVFMSKIVSCEKYPPWDFRILHFVFLEGGSINPRSDYYYLEPISEMTLESGMAWD